eukprot:TRINITY_DN3792_c0_g1_i1.p1 TRINITY_DN3792_c0_g1~~TRINITY_DN3792_c0_g1_i1.p1  ORF type:complete len:786 (-),score=79.73 TRINITY_DN3792_c0_g1_i1:50-2407(-)
MRTTLMSERLRWVWIVQGVTVVLCISYYFLQPFEHADWTVHPDNNESPPVPCNNNQSAPLTANSLPQVPPIASRVCSMSHMHVTAVSPCEGAAVGEEVSVFFYSSVGDEAAKLYCIFDFAPTLTDTQNNATLRYSNCERTSRRLSGLGSVAYYHVPAMTTAVVVVDPVWVDPLKRVIRCRVPRFPSLFKERPSPDSVPDKQEATLHRTVVTVGLVYTSSPEGAMPTYWDGTACHGQDPGGFTVFQSSADLLVYSGVDFATIQESKEPPAGFEELLPQGPREPTFLREDNWSNKQESTDPAEILKTTECLLGMCLSVRTQNYDMVRQFIEYHRLLGIRHFVFYDNNNTVPLRETLADYLEPTSEADRLDKERIRAERHKAGQGQNMKLPPPVIHIIEWHMPFQPQHAAMSHCLDRYGSRGVVDLTVIPVLPADRKRFHMDESENHILQLYSNPLHQARVRARGGMQCEWLSFNDIDEWLLPDFEEDRDLVPAPAIYKDETWRRHRVGDDSTVDPPLFSKAELDSPGLIDPTIMQLLGHTTLFHLNDMFRSNTHYKDTYDNWVANKPIYYSKFWLGTIRYGPDGHVRRPKGILAANYIHRQEEWDGGDKSLVQRRFFSTLEHNIHNLGAPTDIKSVVEKKGKLWATPNTATLGFMPFTDVRANHYTVRSWEDAMEKITQPRAGHGLYLEVNQTLIDLLENRFREAEAQGRVPEWPSSQEIDSIIIGGLEHDILWDYRMDTYTKEDIVGVKRYFEPLRCALGQGPCPNVTTSTTSHVPSPSATTTTTR